MAVRGSHDDLVRVDTARAVISRVNLLEESNALAIDIGGNLAKLLYLQPHGVNTAAPTLVIDRLRSGVAPSLSVHVPALSGTLHFFAFETRNVEELATFIRLHWLDPKAADVAEHKSIRATGGGSYKYARLFCETLGVTLARFDEMTCAVAGLNFMLSSVHEEVYSFVPPAPTNLNSQFRPGAAAVSIDSCRKFVPASANPFPYVLVNIGSGVSIVKVTGHGKFERISGSSLGGGTFWGLARLLLNCSTFDDVIELTNRGNHANVDMLVGDIYGGAYSSLNLDATVIAASFGKVTMSADEARPVTSWMGAKKRFFRAIRSTFDLWLAFFLAIPVLGTLLRILGLKDPFPSKIANLALSPRFRPQDVAMSLLRMVSYNIGQIAYLNARVHNLERIYFGGNFIRNHPHTIADIAFAVEFWSQGKTKALFLKHDGYLGAIGAFIGAESASPAEHVPACSAGGKQSGKITEAVAAGQAVAGAPVVANGGSKQGKARSRKSRVRTVANGTNGVDEPNGSVKANGVAKSSRAAKPNGVSGINTGVREGAQGSSNGISGDKKKEADDVLYYDENSEAYREAVAGEWTTVVPRGKRKAGDA